MPTLQATTFEDSHHSFTAALTQHGLKYNKHIKLGANPVASRLNIEIIISGGWGALAVACLAWAHVRKSRRINVTTKDKHAVWLEGYSAEEAARILESASRIAAIETKPIETKQEDDAEF
ncbi:hypothetical protein [Nevskia soli]|uniref:hypothetical protein n=1 Tax=Nevskia soli TaxID=418856 RepID=UPI0012F7D136|nr:hypothetical protein [Nevskia soli]